MFFGDRAKPLALVLTECLKTSVPLNEVESGVFTPSRVLPADLVPILAHKYSGLGVVPARGEGLG